jgi:D-alanyl-D-alanine carboxypeptidase
MGFLARWHRPWEGRLGHGLGHGLRHGLGHGLGRRLGVAALALAFGLQALLAPAHARVAGRHAVLVIDANTGRVLYQASADELRFPASLAKLMTLYLIFEAIEQGRITYRTKIRFSANAASTAPSRLDVEEGSEIEVVDAIKALITKSANDVAVAVAEHLAGSEARFAQMMTQKAGQLGMAATQFRNASGLPDPEQVTTARDMIALALRLHDDFPQHYPLFATPTFTYKGETYRNHNTLLFSYQGTEGLKTGYTRASGFNVVTSVRRGRKHVVGVVFGGATAATRNAAMRTYLNMGLMKASNEKTRRPAPRLIAQPKIAVAPPAPQPAQRPAPQPGSPAIEMARVRPVLVTGTNGPPAPPDSIEALLARPAMVQMAQPPSPAPASPPSTGGAFHIQIGAFQSQTEAERQLAAIRERVGALLVNRSAVTTPLRQGEKTLYRARYAGFEAQAAAASVCSELKRLNISCLVMAAE